MGRKSRRSVYDPSIIDRIESDNGIQADPLSFIEQDEDVVGVVRVEEAQPEILDPKLHGSALRKPNRCRRNFLWSIVACGVIGIIVTLSIIIARAKSPNSSSRSYNYLAPPPEALSAICSPANAQAKTQGNMEALLECEKVCQAAECCEYPPQLEMSCLRNNEVTCLNYHKNCNILNMTANQIGQTESKTIPAAPQNLDQVCSIQNLASEMGVRSCAAICVEVECCYETGVLSCASNTNCNGYSSCLNLRVHDNVNMDIAAEVNQKCSLTNLLSEEGVRLCYSVCDIARCCFTDNDDCYGKDSGEDFCSQYQACNRLYDGTATLPSDLQPQTQQSDNVKHPILPKLPKGINNACKAVWITGDDDALTDDAQPTDDDDSVDDDDDNAGLDDDDDAAIQDCVDMCEPASCCDFPANLPQSCLAGNERLCMRYKRSCAVLSGNAVEDPNIQLDANQNPTILYDLCSPASIATAHGLAECSRRCEPAKCCYAPEDGHCLGNENCDGYAPCLALSAIETEHSTITDVVNQLCTAESVMTPVGRDVCQSVCKSNYCCIRGDCSENVACEQYKGCEQLFDEGFKPINAGHAILPNFDDSGVTEACEEAALQAAADNILDDDLSYDDDDFNLLDDDDSINFDDDNIDDDEVNAFFDDDDDNVDGLDGDGDLGNDDLDGNEPPSSMPSTADNIVNRDRRTLRSSSRRQRALVKSSQWTPWEPRGLQATTTWEQCRAKCLEARCCFIPPEFQESCLKGNEKMCMQYHLECIVLQVGAEDSAPVTLEKAPTSLGDSCSSDSLSTKRGLRRCKRACAPAACCYDVDYDGENCRNHENCLSYAPCLNLLASNQDADVIEDEVLDKCTIEGFLKPGGREICEAVCQQHTCCWKEDSGIPNCFREAACRQYDGCGFLLNSTIYTPP